MKKLLVYSLVGVSLLFVGCQKVDETPAEVQVEEGVSTETPSEETEQEAGPVEYSAPSNFVEERTGKTEFDSYDEIVSNLTEGEGYAYINIMGCNDEVLVITDGLFDDIDGKACIECYPYLKNESGKYICGSVFSSNSTSTPIAVSTDGKVYCATHDTIDVYVIAKETGQIMGLSYAYVEWGENDEDNVYGGFVRETNSIEEEPRDLTDDAQEVFERLFEEQANATPIYFTESK